VSNHQRGNWANAEGVHKIIHPQRGTALAIRALTVNQEDAFIEEAGFGFAYNKAIFEELGDYADSLTPMAV